MELSKEEKREAMKDTLRFVVVMVAIAVEVVIVKIMCL